MKVYKYETLEAVNEALQDFETKAVDIGVTIVPEDTWDNGAWRSRPVFYVIVNERAVVRPMSPTKNKKK